VANVDSPFFHIEREADATGASVSPPTLLRFGTPTQVRTDAFGASDLSIEVRKTRLPGAEGRHADAV
jgi:hypothetical protein